MQDYAPRYSKTFSPKRRLIQLAATGFCLLLLSCSTPEGAALPPQDEPVRNQQACPYAISHSAAWINLMPSIGPARRPLVVSLTLRDPKARARLLTSVTSSLSSLHLELTDDPDSTTPGRVSWRSEASGGDVKKVVITCRGVNLHVIESVEIVQ